MKITAQEEYGLRCLIQIGRHADEEGITIAEVSRLEGLTTSNTAKLTRILRMNGFITSIRGKAGGYTLAKPAEEIVIGDVLNALGGKLFGEGFCVHYSGQDSQCIHFSKCSLRSFWCAIQSVLDHVLGQTTLQDLMQPNGFSWWQSSLTANPLLQTADTACSSPA